MRWRGDERAGSGFLLLESADDDRFAKEKKRMTKPRFLRDNVLNSMLDDIRKIAFRIESQEVNFLFFQNSISSLEEVYETNKLVLYQLEKVIEQLRDQNAMTEVIDSLVGAAAHVQIGLSSLHNSLKIDLDQMHEFIINLKSSIEKSSIS